MANQRDPLSGMVYIKRCTRDGDKAPFMEGFIGVSKELLQQLLELDEDDYSQVKLDISLWKNEDQPGVLKGTARLPYKIRKEREAAGTNAPTNRAAVSKKVTSKVKLDIDEDSTDF